MFGLKGTAAKVVGGIALGIIFFILLVILAYVCSLIPYLNVAAPLITKFAVILAVLFGLYVGLTGRFLKV